jgi:hypothetical protein
MSTQRTLGALHSTSSTNMDCTAVLLANTVAAWHHGHVIMSTATTMLPRMVFLK